MNRPYSRFVPHSGQAHQRRRASGVAQAYHACSAAVSRPAYQHRISLPERRTRKAGRSYWFPIATLTAAVLFAVSAVMPSSIFDVFASNDGEYSVGIESLSGRYTVTVTGNNSTGIELPGENASKTVNSDGTVTFTIDLDEETNYAIESSSAISSVAFGNVEASAPDEGEISSEGGTPADGDDEGGNNATKAGAEAIKAIDLSGSGATSVDVSQCTGLKSVLLAGNEALTEHASTSITYGSQEDLEVVLDATDFEYADRGEQGKGYFFDAVGAGDFEDLTATLYGDIPVAKEEGRFFISFEDLDATFSAGDNHGAPESTIYIKNSKQPGITYTIFFHAGYVGEYMDPETNPETDPAQSGNGSSESGTGSSDDTGSDSGDDSEAPNVRLTIEANSKNVIKDAYIENVSDIKPSDLKIVAKALSSSDRKTFLAAVKKKDKDFDDTDSNLLVYNIYIVDSKGNKVDLKGKAAVTATLAYPSYQVEYLRDEYDFAVYHQLADKSIDTGIDAYPIKDGIQFTTDSFSNFAISCSRQEQNYTDLVVHDNSKKIISSARAHEGTTFSVEDEDTAFSAGETWIIAEAPTAEEKKEFFDAIKKVNKDFNEKDGNLIVYKVSLRNIQTDQPSEISGNGKVDFTLVYPNDTLKKNYSKYNYTVYHQLADKSIDSKQLAVSGKDGITVTTDGFSLFAVASTPKPAGSDVPKTGESSVSANIALLLALLSMLSFAAVYAKNKAEQY